MSTGGWIILGVVLLVLWVVPALVRHAFRDAPDGDWVYAALRSGARWICRVIHHAQWTGLEHVPASATPGPLIVVSNHTAGLDPVLVSAGVPFRIRYMMAVDYATDATRWFWNFVQVITVARDGSDSAPTREAIRHVRSGGVLGIFPEGGIPDPPGEIRPFLPGAGLIIARAKAPVLLVWVSGTPRVEGVFKSLITPSHSRVEYLGLFDFSNERDAKKITNTLREELSKRSGWPLSDEMVRTARKPKQTDPFLPS